MHRQGMTQRGISAPQVNLVAVVGQPGPAPPAHPPATAPTRAPAAQGKAPQKESSAPAPLMIPFHQASDPKGQSSPSRQDPPDPVVGLGFESLPPNPTLEDVERWL